MSPIMIGDWAIIFLDRGQPAAQSEVIDVETPQKVQIDEHP